MMIEPKVLKGFRDFLPETEIERKRIEKILELTFELFGFVPIDTPVLEYREVLLGKGGGETDKQVYQFIDHGNREVALRFDLTVPFARFMAGHLHELGLPFKRYHIAKVWRGENSQRGRYREFTQCDFDIVGTDSASSDFEILLMMQSSFKALGIEDITIRLSHRGIFNRFLRNMNVEDKSVDIMRSVDKMAKIGRNEVEKLLSDLTSPEISGKILDYIEPEADFLSTLEKMKKLAGGPSDDTLRLEEIYACLKELSIENFFFLDPSITRGLDYYTGLVYETFLNQLPDIGSVCSGGRYNNLASIYSKTEIPGVGSSIGLDRLMAALEELKIGGKASSGPDLIIFCLDEKLNPWYHGLARKIRDKGFSCEVYFQKKKLTQQFSFAEKKGIHFALICGEEEKLTGTVTLKNLKSRNSFEKISLEEALNKVIQKTESE